MSVSSYRLNKVGVVGAMMFVLPTPIAILHYRTVMAEFAKRGDFNRRLENMAGMIAQPNFSFSLLIILATASLIGLVLLLVGREIVTEG